MSSPRVWALAAFLTVSLAFASIFDTSEAGPILNFGCTNNTDCGCTPEQAALNCSAASGAGGFCPIGLNQTKFRQCVCNPGFAGPSCSPTGACCGAVSQPCLQTLPASDCAAVDCQILTEAQCMQGNGTYVGDGTSCAGNPCDPATPTATATATATATPTRTPVAPGGACTDASQCAPGLFCSDAVCCDTACAGPGQSCDVPGQEGICVTASAQAPTASDHTLAVMLGLLFVTGLIGLRAGRR